MTTNRTRVFEDTIKKVNDSLGSLFTKDDVVKVLSDLLEELNENDQEVGFDESKLCDAIFKSLRDVNFEDYIEIDSQEYSINHGNEISLDSYDIEVDRETLADQITSDLKQYFNP